MAVLSKTQEIELVVTWVCNWDCEYCCVDTHNRDSLTMNQVKAKLKKVIPGHNVTISGGEPGALKRDDVEYILTKLESMGCEPSINTNGTFIRKYPDLLPRFETILYHCSENIDPKDDTIIGDYDYLLIVTDNTIDNLGAFLEKYKDIQFNLVAATNPDGVYGPTLSNKNKHRMLKLYHSRMTKESIRRVFNEKDFDTIIYI